MNIYNPNYYISKSTEYISLPKLVPYFVLCQEIFANAFDVEYEANLACATQKKKARLIRKTYFSTCYLLSPIANYYECYNPDDENIL